MTTSEKRRLAALACIVAAIVPAAVVARRPATELARAIRAYGPAHELQARLARTHASFQLLALADGRGPSAVDGAVTEAAASARALAGDELRGLLAAVATDPELGQRLEPLNGLAQRGHWLGAPDHAWGDEALEPELERLTGELEAAGRDHLRRLDAVAATSLGELVLVGSVGGASALLLLLLALVVAPWDGAGHRWSARRVVKLLARQRQLTDRIRYLDHYDPLTGLPNRKSLAQALERAIGWARQEGRGLAVLITDVNRLKHINDLCGLEAGDEALRQVARRLQGLAGDREFVARIAGGEFAMVLAGASPSFDASARAEQVQRAVSQRSGDGENAFVLTSAIGISSYPDHGRDGQTLLRNADLALVRARSVGRNTIQVFDDQIKTVVSDLFVLEKHLSRALENGEYLVHYQPCCDLATNQVAGAEALVKWRRPAGVIAASTFIPVLEDTGMIIGVGQWVLETACRHVKEWQARDRLLPVAVNLSLAQFRDRYLVDMVADAIGAFQLSPGHLAFEITESVCLQDMEFAIRTLKRLKDLGVSISVDDFGTGYSSLSYLKKLPVDTVKIDISFVRDVTRDQDAVSIVSAITALARSLGLKTVAEGIETEEQRRILHLLRCDLGQGFLFSPALPAAQFEAFASQERKPEADLARAT